MFVLSLFRYMQWSLKCLYCSLEKYNTHKICMSDFVLYNIVHIYDTATEYYAQKYKYKYIHRNKFKNVMILSCTVYNIFINM